METFTDALLLKTGVYKDLTDEEFASLFAAGSKQTYKKGEIILKQGMRMTWLVYLTRGLVKFHYDDQNEKALILTIDKAPTLLGLANILNEDINVFSIYAIEDCEGYLIDVNRIKLLFLNNRMFMLNVLKMSTIMFRKSIFNFISLAHKQVNGRIADVLLYLAQHIYEQTSFTLSLSREEIAQFAGCSKENVIHTLRKFHHEGIIAIEGKSIQVLDLAKLQHISKVG